MAVSAATIEKGHNSGLYFILGESHASMPMGPRHAEHRDRDYYISICSVYLYHTSLTVRYGLRIDSTEQKRWYYRIRAKDKDGDWKVMQTENALSGTYDVNYTWKEGDINIAATPDGDLTANFPLGKIYEWDFQIQCATDQDYWVWIIVWGLFCRESISGWQTPHDFAEDETSAASHFNDIRTDLNLLRDQLSPIVPFSFSRNLTKYDDDDEHPFVTGVYRYRPDSLYGMIKVEFEEAGSNFRLYIRLYDTAGNGAKVYESGNIAATGHDQVVEAEVSLIDNGIGGATPTVGTYYAAAVGIERQDGSVAYDMEFGAIARTSSGTPHASWAPLNEWAEGDTDFGPTHLDKMKTNLELFYTGGGEAMWGESPSVLKWYPTISTRRLSTIHRKRWLVYHIYSGSDPLKIWYGDDYDDSFELPLGDGWLNQDLTELPIPWGSYYSLVGNCDGAFECDGAYN